MKRLILACVLTVLASTVCLAGMNREDYWDVLSTKAEAERMETLGVVFTEPGDASDDYMPYLKNEAPITQKDWFSDIRYSMIEEPEAGDKEKLSSALKEAAEDLNIMVKASRKKECNVYGKHIKPNVEKTFYADDILNYISVMRLCVLLSARAEELADQGKFDEAKEQGLAVMRIGSHMENDPIFIGYVLAAAIKKNGAKSMVTVCEKSQSPGEVKAWKMYLDVLKGRELVRNSLFMEFQFSFGEEDMRKLVAKEDFPRAMKLELISGKYYCIESKSMFLRCAALGPPDYVIEVMDQFAKESEINKLFMDQLKAHELGLKDISFIETIGP